MEICCLQLMSNNTTRMMKPSVARPLIGRRERTGRGPTTISAVKTDNFYEVLSLRSEEAGLDDIKRAYRCMARQWHPDVCHHPDKAESTRRFIQLREAYETLSDPVSREIYDHKIGLTMREFGGRRGRPSVFPREVWERQLSGLKTRSRRRTEKSDTTYTVF